MQRYISILFELPKCKLKPQTVRQNHNNVKFRQLLHVSALTGSLSESQLAGKVFTHKCDTGNLSALIQC